MITIIMIKRLYSMDELIFTLSNVSATTRIVLHFFGKFQLICFGSLTSLFLIGLFLQSRHRQKSKKYL